MKELLEQYVPRVYRFALRLTANPHAAEDLTQETMLRAWRSRRFLENSQATRVWLFRITVNLWRDQLRRSRSAVARAGQLSAAAIDPIATPDCQAADAESLRLAMESLQQLPDLQRQALYLRACEGLSAVEIAAVLRTSADSVKTSLCIARKRLREQLRSILDSLFMLL